MAMRGPRQPVGSAAWVAEERSSATQIGRSEAEEFTYSVRNEFEWLNEHMAGIFDENQQNFVDVFKTPGKLRGRTPRTVRKQANPIESRAPLSDIFSATPKGAPNPFATASPSHGQNSKLAVAGDVQFAAPPSPTRASPPKAVQPSPRPPTKHQLPPQLPLVDSGYHSQSQDVMDVDGIAHEELTQEAAAPGSDAAQVVDTDMEDAVSPAPADEHSPTQPTHDASFHSAKEEQTKTARPSTPEPASAGYPTLPAADSPSPIPPPKPASPVRISPIKAMSPQRLPQQASSTRSPVISRKPVPGAVAAPAVASQPTDDQPPSDASSPIRPVVRKSSMSFASLPAREPLATGKSIGARMSRTSHLDHTRQSYYNRPTGGKSLGNVRQEDDDDDNDEMDIDDETTAQNTTDVGAKVAAHNKTYTQRLQDQISMLGKSHSTGSRTSKSFANPSAAASQSSQPVPEAHTPSPKKLAPMVATPGAFPDDDEEEDEEDEWVAPDAAKQQAPVASSPRPGMAKSYTADVMEGLIGKESISGAEFTLPKQRQAASREASPKRPLGASNMGHAKSSSVPLLPSDGFEPEEQDGVTGHGKSISVSNPLSVVPEDENSATPKSPSRTFRDSPLKQVKNKLSSILKSSKGLLASSAAISAEGKSSLLSPSSTRLGYHAGPSVDSLAPRLGAVPESLYPDLSQQVAAYAAPASPQRPTSPTRAPTRKTRASMEREKREQKQRDKDAKEAQRMADQMGKLEKARDKEREKARYFSKEQERIAMMERQLEAQREQERAAAATAARERQLEAQREQERAIAAQKQAEAARRQQEKERQDRERQERERLERQERERLEQERLEQEARARPPSPVKETPRPMRSSPRKVKGQASPGPSSFDDDMDMADAPISMPPPSVPRSAVQPKSTLRRPVKPTKEVPNKARQAPTVIRVNTTSQHSQMHPSNSVLAATLGETLAPQAHQLKPKASMASLQAKPSMQSLKSSASSTGRPKALEMAAKRKEQEEREAERKREAKQELERKRENQRRQEADKQKEEDRKQAAAQAEAKKNAQRQAIEKAKQTRAPPPAQRSQQNGRPEYGAGPASIPRPQSRLDTVMRGGHDELSRPGLASAVKPAPKRPMPQQDDDGSRQNSQQRAGPSYQPKEQKRIRLTEEFDVDELEMGGVMTSQSNMKAPPVRPSGGFKKDLPTKALFPNGYTSITSQSATRDLFKTTLTTQHNNQVKAAHPLDMAQLSKGTIPFAPNPNSAAAGPSTHKTPARPVGQSAKSAAKSAARSSPRIQLNNGDAIELPDIQTDDEDSDEEEDNMTVAPWVNSPDLRRALMRQEAIDPENVFGPPAPLNMEEVFSRNKEKWHQFRKRTSSANWSGADKLTEEDIRKDLAAREKIRREGGWSYELSKETL
ncbi:inner centromere protein [Magnaporthiopsis poae ATCC 64411]|uniref:Inner centromere protein n=1 Tax=Magnaporthiopsis poae (strain ATCC 64411 / 73-15) TaxID=644358 RepID=A0A0C4DY93_MAGP6|nr:inner centromere protein [Magnaporthiopsis poae ATCC 64411]